MKCQAALWVALTLIPPAFSQHVADSSSTVNGYPATLDANHVYSPGQTVKVDEPHGVYTGVIVMDDYYFLRPLTVTDTERKADAVEGSLSASVRRATSPTWQTITLAFVCENRDFKIGRNELARVPDGKQIIVGSHSSVCTLKHEASNNVPAVNPNSHVFVEPWQALIRDTTTVNAGRAVQYSFPLVAGTKLSAQFHVQGGINDKIQVLLLDAENYQLYSVHRPFKRYPGTSGLIQGVGKYDFKIPQDGVYYVVLDNGQAWLMPRNVTAHVDAILPQSTPASEQLATLLEALYSKLKQVFIFPDFHVSVRHCGVVNAFSNPNITLCAELLDELQAKGMMDAFTFVYLHELGHTLMKEWGLPLWDNEDAADEFATAFLLMANQQKIALTAAQWWSSEGASKQDAVAKIWMDDRHSLSPSVREISSTG